MAIKVDGGAELTKVVYDGVEVSSVIYVDLEGVGRQVFSDVVGQQIFDFGQDGDFPVPEGVTVVKYCIYAAGGGGGGGSGGDDAEGLDEGLGGQGGNGGNGGMKLSGELIGLSGGLESIAVTVGGGGASGVGGPRNSTLGATPGGKGGDTTLFASLNISQSAIAEGGNGGTHGEEWSSSSNDSPPANVAQTNNAQGGLGNQSGSSQVGANAKNGITGCPHAGVGGNGGVVGSRHAGPAGGGGGGLAKGGNGGTNETAGSGSGVSGGGGGGSGGAGGSAVGNNGRSGLNGGKGGNGRVILTWSI